MAQKARKEAKTKTREETEKRRLVEEKKKKKRLEYLQQSPEQGTNKGYYPLGGYWKIPDCGI